MITDTVMRMGIGAVARQRVGFPIDVVFIGLLRGINVGGRNKLAMQDLRSICESLGWKKVRTYIQSGNVVFETPRAKPGRLAEQLADALEEHMSVRLAVLVRTAAEFEAVIETNAFARRRTLDPMPRYEESLRGLRQDVIDGEIDRAHDLAALQVALSSLLRGYRIFREPYAKRIDTDADDLDARVARIARTWLEAMARPPATKE